MISMHIIHGHNSILSYRHHPQPVEIGNPDSGRYVKFTPKYIIVVGEEGVVSELFLWCNLT